MTALPKHPEHPIERRQADADRRLSEALAQADRVAAMSADNRSGNVRRAADREAQAFANVARFAGVDRRRREPDAIALRALINAGQIMALSIIESHSTIGDAVHGWRAAVDGLRAADQQQRGE